MDYEGQWVETEHGWHVAFQGATDIQILEIAQRKMPGCSLRVTKLDSYGFWRVEQLADIAARTFAGTAQQNLATCFWFN